MRAVEVQVDELVTLPGRTAPQGMLQHLTATQPPPTPAPATEVLANTTQLHDSHMTVTQEQAPLSPLCRPTLRACKGREPSITGVLVCSAGINLPTQS